jgi:hypothetical protein
MAFKIFPRAYRLPRTTGSFLTVSRSGCLMVSPEFGQKHLSEVSGVGLTYDKGRRIIGIQPLKNIADEDAYPVRTYRRGTQSPTFQIQCHAFFRYFGIQLSNSMRRVPSWNIKYGVWEVHLDVEDNSSEQGERNFERFSRGFVAGSRRGNYISITTSGRIMFALGFGLKHLGDCRFVELYFDDERRVLGIKPLKQMTEAAFELRIHEDRKKSKSILINVSTFLRFYKIDHSIIRRYTPLWNEAAQLWEIQLDNPLKGKKGD